MRPTLIIILFIFQAEFCFAQNGHFEFTVNEAQQYALQNNANVQNAKLDVVAAKKKVWETTAIGLPHVNASYNYQHIPGDLPTFMFPSPDGSMQEVALGVKNSATYDITVTQLIFSGEYIVGLQASRTYKMLSQTSLVKSEKDIKENIAQSYYTILVLERNSNLLDSSLINLEKLYAETQAMAKSGFLEETSADQILVTLNTLKNSSDIVKKQVELSYKFFKIQMGLNLEDTVILKEKLDDILNIEAGKELLVQTFNLTNNVDYQLLETQEKLMDLSVKREMSTFLPTVSAFYMYQDKTNKADFDFTINNIVGIGVNIPIFASGQKLSKVSQAKIELEKTRNTKNQISESLRMSFDQARYDLEAALNKYETQKLNVDLSFKIYNNTLIKYKQGMASSMDVSQAHSQYIESNSNYTSTVLELLNAKLVLQNLLNQL